MAMVVVQGEGIVRFWKGWCGGCGNPSVLRQIRLRGYKIYLNRRARQLMIKSSLVAIQLPLLKGAKNVVQGEGIVRFWKGWCGEMTAKI